MIVFSKTEAKKNDCLTAVLLNLPWQQGCLNNMVHIGRTIQGATEQGKMSMKKNHLAFAFYH